LNRNLFPGDSFQLGFQVSHPFRGKARKGWGTRICFGIRFHGAAIELSEAEIAVEAEALGQGFADCGIERGWQLSYSTIN
jgi:hypothetical protein